jgi:NAD(P)H dehydrogenase (quinone)
VKAARAAGVKHVVYTSLVNPEPGAPMPIAADHYATEQALVESGMGYTLLRENLLSLLPLNAVKDAIQSGKLENAIGAGRAAYVTREDIARVAAALMTDGFDGQRTLDITGPEAVSQEEIAAIASEISGRAISYVPVDISVMEGRFVAQGMSPALAHAYASFDTGIAQGLFAGVSDTVERLTGKMPTSVREFLLDHRDELLAETAA